MASWPTFPGESPGSGLSEFFPTYSHNRIVNAFLIFLGGGLGALSRWGLSTGIEKLAGRTPLHQFPLGIMVCNLLGCFLIGCVFGYFLQKHPSWVFPLLVTGFLGGFTTFSTFGHDTFAALQDGLTLLAILNILVSVILGVLAVWAGLRLCTPPIAV